MKYEFTSLQRSFSFWEALDEVARERKFLIFLEGPDKQGTRCFLENILEKKWTQFFAIEDNGVVGWADIIPAEREAISHVGQLGMGVLRNFRSQGIGKKLLRLAIEDAFSKGLTRIHLNVFSSNEPAIGLYKKVGFQHEGKERQARCIDGVYEDILVMGLLRDEYVKS